MHAGARTPWQPTPRLGSGRRQCNCYIGLRVRNKSDEEEAMSSQVPSTLPDTMPVPRGMQHGRPPQPARALTHMEVEFTGSGGAYFRLWSVNLLLTLLTLGLYYPWARVRTLRYFSAHTRVGGHALDFHGNPRRMLRGYLLLGLLAALYSAARRASPAAGLLALGIVTALGPALFRASMQFRLANTSWRGRRLGFNGSLREAYAATLPMLLPVLLFLGAAPLFEAAPDSWSRGLAVAYLLLTLPGSAVMPWAFWKLKKYQHDHYTLGDEQTTLRASARSFYALSFRTAGVGMCVGILGGLLAMAPALLARGAQRGPGSMLLAMLAGLLGYLLALAVVGAYGTSRLQDLLWNRTASEHLRFGSDLHFVPLLRLTLANGLLVGLTLGLYWPFAVVARSRMRLGAMSLLATVPLESLSGGSGTPSSDASGEAAVALFGIDMGM
jgi:uncharacterized membrane protein YjgN (DUF898 family)